MGWYGWDQHEPTADVTGEVGRLDRNSLTGCSVPGEGGGDQGWEDS